MGGDIRGRRGEEGKKEREEIDEGGPSAARVVLVGGRVSRRRATGGRVLRVVGVVRGSAGRRRREVAAVPLVATRRERTAAFGRRRSTAKESKGQKARD